MKRIAIYAYYDENGVIADYALFFLKELLEIADEIIIVINSNINPKELLKLANPKFRIISRENTKQSFWAYREGILAAGLAKLSLYDELILANSSVFGPVFPLKESFLKMQTADFWGAARYAPIKNKECIQNYFLVFKKKMFLSSEFLEYFKKLKKIKTKKQEIKLEINFTQYFKKRGFSFDTLVSNEIFKYKIDDPALYLSALLLKQYSFPFIKKAVFGAKYSLAQKQNGGAETFELFEYLKQTNYDPNLIIKEIVRIYPMDEIQRFLRLNFALNVNMRAYFGLNRIAVFTLEDFVKNHLKKTGAFLNVFEPVKNESWLKQIKDLAQKFDFVLAASQSGNKTDCAPYKQQKYLNHLLNCTIFNKIYPANVVDTFLKNPHIGVLVPIPYLFDGFKISKNYVKNKDIKEFCERINYTGKINPVFLNTIPEIFWIRKEVLNSIKDVVDFDFENKLNKGMIFSILAQKYGFLTGTIAPFAEMSALAGDLIYSASIKKPFLDDLAVKFSCLKEKFYDFNYYSCL